MRNSTLALLVLFVVPGAAAQWRDPAPDPGMRSGQPQVLVPELVPAPVVATPWASLRDRLGERNRVMLFWESELESTVATRYREVTTVDRHDHVSAGRLDGVAYTREGPVGVSLAGGRSGTHERQERFAEAETPAAPSVHGESRQIRTHFMEQLRQGGVRFVDRTLATRLAAATAEGDRPNVHAIETRALAGHADFLLQVTSTADDQSGSGRDFHVVLLAVDSGEALLAFNTPAAPHVQAPGRYQAASAGFVRGVPAAPLPADIGRVLALETAQRIQEVVR